MKKEIMFLKNVLIFSLLLIACTSSLEPEIDMGITREADKVANIETPTTNFLPESTPIPTRLVIADGTLAIASSPSNANVSLIEREITGTTPLTTTLPPGDYTIELNLSDYLPWKKSVAISEKEITSIEAYLIPKPMEAGKYIKLVDLGGLGEVYSLPSLVEINWNSKDQLLEYALDRGLGLSEPKDWSWWKYDLQTEVIKNKVPPLSSLDNEIRKNLGLCPLNSLNWEGPAPCEDLTALFESEDQKLIAFSPLSLDDFPYDEGELWIANNDGTNAQKIANFAPAYVNWSTDGQWFITGEAIDALSGQMTHYLGKTDGTFFESLQSITGVDSFFLNGLFPQFSPDGQSLLLAGTTIKGSRKEEEYQLFILELSSFENHAVTSKFGLFQWALDSKGVYVLDGAFAPFDPLKSDLQQTNLYLVDIGQYPVEEYLIASNIPFHSFTSFGAWNWAYMPLNHALAYVGYADNLELGVLELYLHNE